MNKARIKNLLDQLTEAIAPPENPFAASNSSKPLSRVFPPDYLALVEKYGCGRFHVSGKGALVNLISPFLDQYDEAIEDCTETLKYHQADRGTKHLPYDFDSKSEGVLVWGYSDSSVYYLWERVGMPRDWKVLVVADFEFAGRFELPALEFLHQLFFGEIDCSFLGYRGKRSRIKPSQVEFISNAERGW